MSITFSTTASPSTLRPKNMLQLFGSHTVYLLRWGGVLHLLFDVRDWSEAAYRFGETVAQFVPAERRWYYVSSAFDDARMTQSELEILVADNVVCVLGKDCPKHKSQTA